MRRKTVARCLLAAAALLLAFGTYIHVSAFSEVASGAAASNIRPFLGASLKGLWLADGVSMALLCALAIAIAWKPPSANRAIVVLLAFIPAGTAVCIYAFLGAFIAVPLLAAIAALIFAAGLVMPQPFTEGVLQ